MTKPKVYVLEHLERGVWKPLVSSVRKRRVEEHRDDLIADGDIDGDELRILAYVPEVKK
jgi:hypothetical protein